MKIKPRTKKIIVLSVMVALLVATGVLNWALNDRLTASDPIDANAVTETFFSAYRSEREATRESEFLYLDAIISSETSSEAAKTAAEEQKLGLVERMEKEMQLESLVKAKHFADGCDRKQRTLRERNGVLFFYVLIHDTALRFCRYRYII